MGPEVLIFMLSLDCSVDFDSEFWSGFDAGMHEEWVVNATTSCYEITQFPSNLYGYKSLASRMLMERDANSTAIAGSATDFTTYIDSILGQGALNRQVVFLTQYSDAVFRNHHASGIAYPTENIAFVKNNFDYSTAGVSHELLHLVLEEQGYDKGCYVDKVHENQFKYELKEMSGNKKPILQKFDC